MNTAWILIPLMATAAGWMAGRSITWFLFHPSQPVSILGFRWQGVLPARRQELAGRLGKLISSQVGGAGELSGKLADPGNFKKILPVVEEQVDQFLRVRMVEKMPMIGMLIGEKTIGELKTIFLAELETLFPVVMEEYLNSLQADNGLESAIVEKITIAPIEKWEKLVITAFARELFICQLAGAVFGLLLGLLQLFALILV